ncbi:MAG TPA: type II toxin-antitoxin system Phd/YefM family antitoxin [Bacillus bacterium]|nr:type II toxin-antitoxin system Phd/YefM family antitoxin [Bacillus sp. (in: firmicutes)]
MIITSTELQNNFGKYLILATKEDIFISRNGTVVAKLSPLPEFEGQMGKIAAVISEGAEDYSYIGFGQKATFEEFLELRNNSDERVEYIDGQIYFLASPKVIHQRILGRLFGTFHNTFKGKKCEPFMAPFDIELKRTPEKINMVQPDLMIICDLEEKLGEDDYYKGVPDLIVEILSKSTQSKDMVKKLELYLACGVKEYWIVNPWNQEVTVYQYENATIEKSKTFKTNEMIQSFIFEELAVELNDIFE